MKQNVVLEMRIGLKFFVAAENRAPAVCAAQKKLEQAPAQLVRDLVECQHRAGTGRTFDLEPLAVVQTIPAQILDQQIVDRHPDWSAPIRVAAEHAALGFAR